MSLDCLGAPPEWARVLEVAARCTGTTPDQAIGLAWTGAQVVVFFVVLIVATGLVLRRIR